MSVLHFPLSILHMLGLAAVSLLCGLLVWPQLVVAWPSIEEKIDLFRRLPPLAKLLLLLFVGAFVVYGSTKTNQVDGAGLGLRSRSTMDDNLLCTPTPLTYTSAPPSVTPEDIARGWQLWEVRTNSNISYAMPEGATMASNWWVRGAFEDCSIVRLGDCSIGGYVNQSNNLNNPNNQTMSFPFGANEYSSLWAFSWGKLRFELANANTEIVAVGAPMSAVPYCCDVWGDGTNFTYACDNTCTCEGCMVYGSYWYEGYALPVWGLECGCHYVPDAGPVGVSISFDRPAVIYEDAYTNMPGEVVHPTRSNAVLRCSVSGGTYGGTFSVTLNEAARQKLRKVRGNTLPQNVRIEPGSSRSYEVEYSVLEPSGSVGDIQTSAVFLEDFLNETHTGSASMTAVKVELEAVYEAPANRNQSRHVYGVGEKVRFKVTPAVPAGTLHVVKADVTDNITEYDTFEGSLEIAIGAENLYQCPATDTRPDVALRFQGVEYRPSMTVVEPQSVEALSVSREGTFWPGDVCMGVMVSRVYVMPYTVSFSGVHIYEVPCTNEIPPTGYFASEYYKGPKTHDYPNAGYLHIPDAENFVMTDWAGRDVAYTNWFEGTLTWKVPIGWRRILRGYENLLAAREVDHARLRDEYSRPLLIGSREDAYTQTFEIEADGTSSIRKFGYKLERSRWLPFGFVSQAGDD